MYSKNKWIYLLGVSLAALGIGNIVIADTNANLQQPPLQTNPADTAPSEVDTTDTGAASQTQAPPNTSIAPAPTNPAAVAPVQVINTPSDDQLDEVQTLIQKNQPKEALKILQPYLNKNPDFDVLVAAAQVEATMNNPQQSLQYFTQALAKSGGEETNTRVALFGIAKMRTWLGNYSDSVQTYNKLLKTQLSAEDKQLVLVGLQKDQTALQPAVANVVAPNTSTQDQAQQLVAANKAAAALKLLDASLKNNPSFDNLVTAAQEQADLNNPQKSLQYYQQALAISGKDETKQRVALFGIAKMQLWLGNNSSANKIYKSLLAMQLSSSDHKLAITGFQKSQAAQSGAAPVITPAQRELAAAQAYVSKDDGADALKVLANQLNNSPSFLVLIVAAQAHAEKDDPQGSLYYYQRALCVAGNDVDAQNTALFGIGKMQFWLGSYPDAQNTYETLMSHKLNSNDYELALAWLMRTLAYEDKPMEAFRMLPPCFKITTPEMVLGASESALWSGWQQCAKRIFENNQAVIASTPADSPVGIEIKNIEQDTAFDAATDSATPTMYIDKENGGFLERDYGFSYSHQLSNGSITSVIVNHLNYQLSDVNTVNGTDYALQEYYFGNVWGYNARFGAASFAHWNPLLWNGAALYHPNDVFSAQLYNQNELIDTVQAVDNRVTDNLTSLDLHYNPFYRLRFLGSLDYQSFTDDNNREGFYASGSYLISNNLGLMAIARVRGFMDSNVGTGNYFDPKQFIERMALLNLSRNFYYNTNYYIEGGMGRQTVLPGTTVTVKQLEGGFVIPVDDFVQVTAYAGYTNSAYSSFTGFTQRYVGASAKFIL